MESIPCYRATHLFPYLELLRTIGAPVEHRLCQAKLPIMLADRPAAYLPLFPSLTFLAEMSQREGIDDLGLRATQHATIADLSEGLRVGISQAPTLRAALERYRQLAALEASYVHVGITRERDTVTLCSVNRVLYGVCGEPRSLRCDEWSELQLLIAIVRAFAGPTWQPTEIALHVEAPLSRYASEQFPNTRFSIGQEAASITVPRHLLSLAPRVRPEAAGARLPAGSEPAAGADPTGEFLSSLRRVLTAYLGDGSPAIELAAELAGTSVRTLQRRLHQAHTTYSDVVQHARFAVASDLLRNTEMKVIDIAYEVGYEDPSHFTRAFRRLASICPRAYRRQPHLH